MLRWSSTLRNATFLCSSQSLVYLTKVLAEDLAAICPEDERRPMTDSDIQMDEGEN